MAEIKWKAQEEIEREENAPKLPNDSERLDTLEQAIIDMMMAGGM